MAASAQISRLHPIISPPLASRKPLISFSRFSPSFRCLSSPLSLSRPKTLTKPSYRNRVRASIRKLSESESIPIAKVPEDLDASIPAAAGVYGVFDANGELQFVGISRNIASSVDKHRKTVPADLCFSVKVGPADTATATATADRTVLQSAWKSWVEEHISATGKPPSGNLQGNYTWTGAPPDLCLTPGRHVSLTVPLEDLIDRLVKEHKVVAFIKGSRRAPQCGFSQKVVGLLESHGVDFVCVDVLDEEHNFGLREKLKSYSNWPTFPQVFAGGELVGGCDIISDLAEKAELKAILQK
ncbi:Glutaredoxin family protein [Rhynchospora pubera]|uniref:Glutaredoxin family protein n=1 Tax=Rhynchospora pubera TaxID=906938 RepID=A0AAV8GX08_9POAL|nr:Glutaredoxin family protein [Rhynchospora pubera]